MSEESSANERFLRVDERELRRILEEKYSKNTRWETIKWGKFLNIFFYVINTKTFSWNKTIIGFGIGCYLVYQPSKTYIHLSCIIHSLCHLLPLVKCTQYNIIFLYDLLKVPDFFQQLINFSANRIDSDNTCICNLFCPVFLQFFFI
jgi:hypothetical protein